VPTIEIQGLFKNYGSVEAVRGVDLSVEHGEVFALLGPNGAGKTTIVEILEGHRQPTDGYVRVLGHDPGRAELEYKDRIGIVLQQTSVEMELSVREALDIYGSAFSKRLETEHLVDIVGLNDKIDARIGTLSGGQTRRLELALGIVGDPDLIFLDEPTTGFDPSARRKAWKVIDNLRSLGKTILLTTHYMDEAQNLSDRLAVISQGVIVAQGTPETLGDRQLSATRISFAKPDDRPLPFSAAVEDGLVVLQSKNPVQDLHRLTSWAIENGIEIRDIEVTKPSLEDVYLSLTGDE
jgi:ABC-2 type transport system ATP-binding protein